MQCATCKADSVFTTAAAAAAATATYELQLPPALNDVTKTGMTDQHAARQHSNRHIRASAHSEMSRTLKQETAELAAQKTAEPGQTSVDVASRATPADNRTGVRAWAPKLFEAAVPAGARHTDAVTKPVTEWSACGCDNDASVQCQQRQQKQCECSGTAVLLDSVLVRQPDAAKLAPATTVGCSVVRQQTVHSNDSEPTAAAPAVGSCSEPQGVCSNGSMLVPRRPTLAVNSSHARVSASVRNCTFTRRRHSSAESSSQSADQLNNAAASKPLKGAAPVLRLRSSSSSIAAALIEEPDTQALVPKVRGGG